MRYRLPWRLGVFRRGKYWILVEWIIMRGGPITSRGTAAILGPFTMRWLVIMHYLWSTGIDYVLHWTASVCAPTVRDWPHGQTQSSSFCCSYTTNIGIYIIKILSTTLLPTSILFRTHSSGINNPKVSLPHNIKCAMSAIMPGLVGLTKLRAVTAQQRASFS
jgi:hypothetical protein